MKLKSAPPRRYFGPAFPMPTVRHSTGRLRFGGTVLGACDLMHTYPAPRTFQNLVVLEGIPAAI